MVQSAVVPRAGRVDCLDLLGEMAEINGEHRRCDKSQFMPCSLGD